MPVSTARTDGRSAPVGGGTALIRTSSSSETAKVSTSSAYAVCTPAKATTTPASAGPATEAALWYRDLRANAAVRCWCGTIRGVSESSAGRCRPSAAATSAATR